MTFTDAEVNVLLCIMQAYLNNHRSRWKDLGSNGVITSVEMESWRIGLDSGVTLS